MSLRQIVGTTLIAGGIAGTVVGGMKSCAYTAEYGPVVVKDVMCDQEYADKELCVKIEQQKSYFRKKIGTWVGISAAALVLVSLGYQYRERGLPSK